MQYANLSRDEVTRVIEGKGAAPRIPLLYDVWIADNVFGGDPAKREQWFRRYPCDVDEIFLTMPGMTQGPPRDPDFFWAAPGTVYDETGGMDARSVLEDWEDAEEFYRTFPDPESPALVEGEKKEGWTLPSGPLVVLLF